MPTRSIRSLLTLILATGLFFSGARLGGQTPETVRAIPAPATALPTEDVSAGVTRFSFLAYGDTRSRHDGIYLQPDHLMVVEGMLNVIQRLKDGPNPVTFVLSSGDGVVDGRQAQQWNISFVDVVARLTKDANVSYFMAAGNHDVTGPNVIDAPNRPQALKNFLDLHAHFIPPEGSARRLSGYPTYAFGYGNTFFLTLDSNLAADDQQFKWVQQQLEGLDRGRYVNVVIFIHHPVFSSGPHGAVLVEAPTAALRARYMPLFNTHHVKAIFSGHEHLFEHWVERYDDESGRHRMDLIVSGGGGAPPYAYRGEPETRTFNLANHAVMEHLVKPGPNPGDNPYQFLVVHVDGDRLSVDVVGVDWGSTFRPYRSNTAQLQDR
jgi:hypothetical protein